MENLEKDLEEKLAIHEAAQNEIERLDVERDKLAVAYSKSVEMPVKILYFIRVIMNLENKLKFCMMLLAL